MSEQEPASTGPKPHPPKPEWEKALERLEVAYDYKPEESQAQAPEFTPPELGIEVNAVEDKEVPVATMFPEAPAPAETDDTAGIDMLETAFAQPAAPRPQGAMEAPAAPEVLAAPEAPEVAKPKREKLTHHDYHTQRPADGSIYRAGKTFQRAPGGTEPAGFVKNGKDEYDKQNGMDDSRAMQNHYDEVMESHDAIEGNEAAPANPERPSYETMDTDNLMLAYAKAEMIGDKFVTDDIRSVYMTAIEEAYTKPGSLISYEEHMEAVARFDRMADAAIEYEKAKDPEHSALVDAAVERANREPTVGEKLKKFWKKGVESAKKLFRPEYWGERFTAAVNKLGEASTWALNLGVNNETDSDEEKDRKRNRNRVVFIAGGAAVALATIAGAYGIGFAVGNGGHHAAEVANAGSGTAGGNTLSAHDQAVANALTPGRGTTEATQHLAPVGSGAAAAEAAQHAQSAAEAIPAAFTVQPNGMGGEQLLESLKIDPTKWHAAQEHLYSISQGHMYRMNDGNIGLRPGQLPEAVRNAINALR